MLLNLQNINHFMRNYGIVCVRRLWLQSSVLLCPSFYVLVRLYSLRQQDRFDLFLPPPEVAAAPRQGQPRDHEAAGDVACTESSRLLQRSRRSARVDH